MRSDHDQQFVFLELFFIYSGQLIQARHLTQARNSAQVAGFTAADLTGNDCGFSVREADTALVFAIANYRHAVEALA